MQTTSKGSDQTARMRRLICGFAGLTYHIVGNLMSQLNYLLEIILASITLLASESLSFYGREKLA